MLRHEAPFERPDHRLQGLKLRRQHDQARTRIDRQAVIPLVRNDRQHPRPD